MAVNEQQKSQIKSKERVSERGEVFTAEREVNAMLDLVANECLRPDSRFLEPACGDGNFLSAILKGCDKYARLIRFSASNAGNDYRLGAAEAPPAIISVFLGDELEEILDKLSKHEDITSAKIGKIQFGSAGVRPERLHGQFQRPHTAPPSSSSRNRMWSRSSGESSVSFCRA